MLLVVSGREGKVVACAFVCCLCGMRKTVTRSVRKRTSRERKGNVLPDCRAEKTCILPLSLGIRTLSPASMSGDKCLNICITHTFHGRVPKCMTPCGYLRFWRLMPSVFMAIQKLSLVALDRIKFPSQQTTDRY